MRSLRRCKSSDRISSLVFSSPKTKNTLDKSSVGVVYLSLQISIVLTATQTCYANRPTAENLIFSSTSASVAIRCGTSSSVKSSSTLKSKSQTAGQLRLRRTKAKKGYNLASDFIPLDIHKYSEKAKEKMLAICSYST